MPKRLKLTVVTLQSCRLFKDLSPEDRGRLEAMAQERRYGPQQVIFQEGDPGDGMYVVRTGRVEIAGTVEDQKHHVLAALGPGEVFGEMAILDDQPRSAAAKAIEPTTADFLPREPLLELIGRSPKLALSLVHVVSHRLREFNRQYVREVLQAERMALVGRFASSIVHDLKNPLTIIGIAADLACSPTTSPENRQIAKENIRRQIDRVNYMVNDILDFTRGTRAEEPRACLDFRPLAQKLLAELPSELAPRGIKLEADPPPSIRLRFNPRRLERVFHNLISNAVDAMPEGGVLSIRFRPEAHRLTVEVADTGRGLPQQIADRLFDPFVTHGKPNGTGLGLAIVQRIIEEHQGAISARNRPEGGAVFTFTLPGCE